MFFLQGSWPISYLLQFLWLRPLLQPQSDVAGDCPRACHLDPWVGPENLLAAFTDKREPCHISYLPHSFLWMIIHENSTIFFSNSLLVWVAEGRSCTGGPQGYENKRSLAVKVIFSSHQKPKAGHQTLCLVQTDCTAHAAVPGLCICMCL